MDSSINPLSLIQYSSQLIFTSKFHFSMKHGIVLRKLWGNLQVLAAEARGNCGFQIRGRCGNQLFSQRLEQQGLCTLFVCVSVVRLQKLLPGGGERDAEALMCSRSSRGPRPAASLLRSGDGIVPSQNPQAAPQFSPAPVTGAMDFQAPSPCLRQLPGENKFPFSAGASPFTRLPSS